MALDRAAAIAIPSSPRSTANLRSPPDPFSALHRETRIVDDPRNTLDRESPRPSQVVSTDPEATCSCVGTPMAPSGSDHEASNDDSGSRDAFAQLLAETLRGVGREIIGEVLVSNDVVRACGGDLTTWGERLPQDGLHPSIAHAHVVAQIGRTSTIPLEACVMGINRDPRVALAEAASNWLHLVGAPILMLLTQRQVFDAEHFGEHDTWGVPGLHGFVGPAFARGEIDSLDIAKLGDASFFRDAASMITGDLPHLLKAILSPMKGGGWQRVLELDGHGSTRVDPGYEFEVPAPAGHVSCVRYAVVFRGH